MKACDRVISVVEGRRPDRVPQFTPTMSCETASRLMGHETFAGSPSLWYHEALAWTRGKNAHEEFDARIVEDAISWRLKFGDDVFMYPWRNTARPVVHPDPSTFVFGDPAGAHQVWRWDAETMNFVETVNTARKPEPEDWPTRAREMQRNMPTTLEQVRDQTGRTEEDTQRRIGGDMLVVGSGAMLSMGVDEASLAAILLEPAAVADILDCQLEVGKCQLDAFARRNVKVIMGGGDMADKNGPIYSPACFHDLLLPRLRPLVRHATDLGLHYVWRTDGRIWPVSDMIFSDAGAPAYGETDRDAGMTVKAVREKFPKVVIWSNTSADLLRRGNADAVYRDTMQILVESGGIGYFNGCSNTVLPGTPLENLAAMRKAADDCARRSST